MLYNNDLLCCNHLLSYVIKWDKWWEVTVEYTRRRHAWVTYSVKIQHLHYLLWCWCLWVCITVTYLSIYLVCIPCKVLPFEYEMPLINQGAKPRCSIIPSWCILSFQSSLSIGALNRSHILLAIRRAEYSQCDIWFSYSL